MIDPEDLVIRPGDPEYEQFAYNTIEDHLFLYSDTKNPVHLINARSAARSYEVPVPDYIEAWLDSVFDGYMKREFETLDQAAGMTDFGSRTTAAKDTFIIAQRNKWLWEQASRLKRLSIYVGLKKFSLPECSQICAAQLQRKYQEKPEWQFSKDTLSPSYIHKKIKEVNENPPIDIELTLQSELHEIKYASSKSVGGDRRGR